MVGIVGGVDGHAGNLPRSQTRGRTSKDMVEVAHGAEWAGTRWVRIHRGQIGWKGGFWCWGDNWLSREMCRLWRMAEIEIGEMVERRDGLAREIV